MKLSEIVLTVLGAVVMLAVFGVVGFSPDDAVINCVGLDIPKEINLVQSERYCKCVRRAVDIPIEVRPKWCVDDINKNKEILREVLTK